MQNKIDARQTAVIDIGTMPATAEEIYTYVKSTLVMVATPLKEKSIELHRQIIERLPEKWEDWTLQEAEIAGELYEAASEHLDAISTAKGATELDTIKRKAFLLHKGITAAINDIQASLPADKDNLMIHIRAWRKREEERAVAEQKRLAAIALKQEEDRRLAEAAELEAEAAKLKDIDPQAAAELQAEAEALIAKPPLFVPSVMVQANIPTGGPKRQTFWKYKIVDFEKLPDTYKMADNKKIGAIVRSLKSQTQIPGVEVWEE